MSNRIFKYLFFIIITAVFSFGSGVSAALDSSATNKIEACLYEHGITKNSKFTPEVRKAFRACIPIEVTTQSKKKLLNAPPILGCERYQELMDLFMQSGSMNVSQFLELRGLMENHSLTQKCFPQRDD